MFSHGNTKGVGKRNDKQKPNNSSKKDAKKSQSCNPFYKWRPPEGNETKRVISTKDFAVRAHVWNAFTKRWIPEGDASAYLTCVPNVSVPVVPRSPMLSPVPIMDQMRSSRSDG
jgi:hypothetical protein